MLIFSRAEVPTYRRGRAGASDGQMHSTVFMMQRHFYNFYSCSVLWMAPIKQAWSRICTRQQKSRDFTVEQRSSVHNQPQNAIIFTFNANRSFIVSLTNTQSKQ